jgi:cell division protein YceG involved in septum cleavage
MLMNGLIVAFSLLMLVYWFRYTCLLLLNTKPVKDYSKQVAAANQLKVFEVQNRLESNANIEHLDELKRLLDRDYQVIMYLMRHGANFKSAGYELNQRMCMLNYQLLKWVYGFSKSSYSPSRQRLLEMANVIVYFANLMGERAAIAPAP